MTEKTFNLQKFSHGIFIDCSTAELYDMVAKADGFTKWFIGKAEYTANNKVRLPDEYINEGDKFHWWWLSKDFESRGEILETQRDSMIKFTFGPLHEVKITIENSGSRAHLRLEQYYKPGAQPNDFVHINCAVCWVFFITNLKSVIEHGIDLRETVSDDEELVNS